MGVPFNVDKLIRLLEVMSMNKTKLEARMLLDLIYDGFFDMEKTYRESDDE